MSLRPVWPVLVVAVPLLLAAGLFVARTWRGNGWSDRAVHLSRLVVAVLLLGIGLRPTSMHRVEVPVPSRTDVLVLLDRTASMGAVDGPGGRSRIEAAADDLTDLVRATGGANVTVVVFDDEARVAVPTTTDVTAVATFLRTVGWRPSAKATGSDIAAAAGVAEQTLQRMARQDPDHERHLVYAGDGEQTQQQAPGSFVALEELVTSALVLGYGTEQGGPMPTAPGASDHVTRDGKEQLSRIDEKNLRAIARQTGGEYLHRTGGGDLPPFARARTGDRTELQPGAEYYWLLALAATPFLLHLLAVALRGLRTAREEAR